MKKIYIIAFFAIISLQSCMVSRHPNMAFFDNPHYDYGNAEFTSVNVPVWLAKPFVKNALREDGESEEVVNLVKKIKKIRILTVENGNPEMLKNFSQYLSKNNYEDWVTLKHDGQNVNIRAFQEGEVIKKLMLLVNSGEELVFVDIKGKFTPEDISNVINMENREEERRNQKRISKNETKEIKD
ncbi:MAG: DUF4252 domain-containing protein [Bergeyella sp.]